MRRPAFSEVFAFLAGVWVAVTGAYLIALHARHALQTFPSRFAAESSAGFRAIYFARTRQPFPPSGAEETLQGVRWRIRYAAPPVTPGSVPSPVQVTVIGESIPEGHQAQYVFQRKLP